METKTNPNDSAFATPSVLDVINAYKEEGQAGLTKREYFAAMALQGLLASNKYGKSEHIVAADEAVYIADYLIIGLNHPTHQDAKV